MPLSVQERNSQFPFLYVGGLDTVQIGKRFGVSSQTVAEYLRKSGVPMRRGGGAKRKYQLNESIFDEVNDESAYWVGFLMADGCVSGNSITLSLSAKDGDHVNKFRVFLGSDIPLRRYTYSSTFGPSSNKTYDAVTLSVHSAKIRKSLSKFGVVPRKSKTAVVNGLANNRHFWRGVIDGDGTLFVDKRYNVATVSLVGSKALTSQFLDFAKLHVETSALVRPHKTIFEVGISGYSAAVLIGIIYSNASIALERKSFKATSILQIYDDKCNARDDHADRVREVIELYKSGLGGPTVAKKTGFRINSIYEILERHRVTRRKVVKSKHPRQTRQKNRGLCKDCESPSSPGRSRCKVHLTKATEDARRRLIRRRNSGSCGRCDDPPLPGKLSCDRHLRAKYKVKVQAKLPYY